jgi:hypothetical protein
MTETRQPFLERVTNSSAVFGFARRIAATSTIWAVGTTAATWIVKASHHTFLATQTLRSTDATVIARRLASVGADSRAVSTLWAFTIPPVAAWHDSGVTRFATHFMRLDLQSKIQATGIAIAVAVIVHIVLLRALHVPVQALGWGTRACLLTAGVVMIRWSRPVAAGWRDRTAQGSIGEQQ